LSTTSELRRKLRLFVSIQQPQLYTLISHLKLQLTEIYLDSKVISESSVKDYFKNFDLYIFIKRNKNIEREVIIISSRLCIRQHSSDIWKTSEFFRKIFLSRKA
jgi:hypothetical protein